MKIQDLTPNPKNPRIASDEKLELLKKSIAEFGDLSGIVFNRKTQHLVGGHQRAKVFGDGNIEILKKFKKPTKTGTVAEGVVTVDGEKFNYREVSWSSAKEKAANIAANKGAGEWDSPQLTEWMNELSHFDSGIDMDLTMFDVDERQDLLGVHDEGGDEEPEGKPTGVSKLEHTCPKCGTTFTNGDE